VEKKSKWSRRPSTRGRNPTAEPLTRWDGKYQWSRGRKGTLLLNPLPDGTANISGEEVEVITTPFHKGKEPYC
jgi:hypothetical protein